MFFGYPVEKLCTYQYSLVALLPGIPLIFIEYKFHKLTAPQGLLQTLDDCGSPPLAARAPTLTRPTSLRTSDHKSMMAFMGLPLDIFGKVWSDVSLTHMKIYLLTTWICRTHFSNLTYHYSRLTWLKGLRAGFADVQTLSLLNNRA